MEKITDSSRGEKRKRDGKDQAEEEPSWAQSKFSEADLQDLVKQCILQPKDGIHWRNASGEFFSICEKFRNCFYFLLLSSLEWLS